MIKTIVKDIFFSLYFFIRYKKNNSNAIKKIIIADFICDPNLIIIGFLLAHAKTFSTKPNNKSPANKNFENLVIGI